jgi:hypothetical protein
VEQIIVSIGPAGEIEVKTQGFKGQGCMKASKWMEEHLGTATEIKKTAEYYAEEVKETVRIKKYGN